MTAQDLKNSILQQAIQGKLVPQNPDDEPASELLKKIAIERQKLIDEDKIKNAPSLPPIEDDEKPFDIPDSWQWVRLGDVCDYGTSESISSLDMKLGKLLIDLEDIEKNSGRLINKKFFNGTNAKSSKYIFRRKNVLYGKLRVYLNKVIIAEEDGYCSSEILPLNFGENIFNRYAQCVLMSPMFVNYATQVSYGTKMPRLGTTDGKLALIPLPPLAEQKRIVAKLEELMHLLERYDAAEKKRSALDKEFPDNLRKSILQRAVQGKLTDQLQTDGDARDLLEKIRAEKAKLIADGKIKKEKPLPPIKDDEKPFDIPDNWQWVRLNDLYNFIDYRGKTPNKISCGIPLVTAKNVKAGYNDYSIKEYISEDEYQNRQSRGVSHKGDILFTTEAPLGNVSIADLDKFSAGQRIITFQAYHNFVKNRLMMFFMLSPSFQKILNANKTGTTVAGIKADKLKKVLIPLPPLAEQERIVAKLNELLPLCDALSEKINHC